MTPRGLPAGTPLGRWLLLPPGIAYDDLREALGAIERVHGDGFIPSVAVRLVTGIADRGRFWFDPSARSVSGISVRADQAHRKLSFVHEAGHLLDLCALGRDGAFGSTMNSGLQGWLRAVLQSAAGRSLREMVARNGAEVLAPSGVRVFQTFTAAESASVRTWIHPEEFWARSYAQFIALESGEADLIRSLDAFRLRIDVSVYYPLQWDDPDFEPVAQAIDGLMRTEGWRA